ncbi:MAG TPA: serine/threonine-protein kinase, partial [Longimicrobiaceae bacterium]|nr:serine/threonine-protein kinase [Longimicrobiaceae bacterium]
MAERRTVAADADFIELQRALVGRYSIERELGRGGMGIVYLAHEVSLDRPVALKVLPAGMSAEPPLRERFLREARMAAKLSHPHIVPIHVVDEVEGFVFFAMAFIDGETLGERVRRQGPLSDRETAKVLREIAWALTYAHAEGVVHRDIKPDNILLERGSGRALVADFGIAHARQDPAAAGEVSGTAEFMSPEQATGGEVGPASDLYALGVVGYFALTGRVPFAGETATAVIARHLTETPPPVTRLAPGTAGSVAEAIDRCLRKSPEARFADGAALADALSRDMGAQPELPVALRVFIARLRRLGESAPIVLLLWLTIGLVPLVADPAEWPLLVLLMFAAAFLVSIGALGYHARRLLEAGYGLEDARLALRQDVERRLEEIRFEYGKGFTRLDRWLRRGAFGGFGAAVLAVVAERLFLLTEPIVLAGFFGGLNVGLWSTFGIAFRGKRRRDWIGETLRKLF